MKGEANRDLSSRLPGQALMELFIDRDKNSALGNLLAGLKGEQETAAELGLLGTDYKVVHSIPIPNERRDLDHVVVGPTGVFVINSKNHHGQSILVDDEYIIYNRNRYQEPSDAARDARRAAAQLNLKKAIPVVAVCGASRISVKSSDVASVCFTHKLVNLITERPEVLTSEQVSEVYKRVIAPKTWGIDTSSLRDPELVAEQYARACSGISSRHNIQQTHLRPGKAKTRVRVLKPEITDRRKPSRAISILIWLAILWGVGTLLSSPNTQVSDPGSSSRANPSALSTPSAAIRDDQTDSVSVTGGSLKGTTMESVRLATYLYMCDGRRVSVATPVGDTVNGETLFFVPPSKITNCIRPTVYHYGDKGLVSGVDPVRGLLRVRLWFGQISGYSIGATLVPGTNKYALTTDSDIELVPTVVSVRDGVISADITGIDPVFVPGAPLFNTDGELIGILDDAGLVITTKSIS
jgi:hypothetical protein